MFTFAIFFISPMEVVEDRFNGAVLVLFWVKTWDFLVGIGAGSPDATWYPATDWEVLGVASDADVAGLITSPEDSAKESGSEKSWTSAWSSAWLRSS